MFQKCSVYFRFWWPLPNIWFWPNNRPNIWPKISAKVTFGRTLVVSAVSCALVFLADVGSTLLLLTDLTGMRLGGMAAKKNPGGSLNCVLAIAMVCPSKWLSTIGHRHLCGCRWYRSSSLLEESSPNSRPRPLMDSGKRSRKKKSRSYLNLQRLHTWRSVPSSFFELHSRLVLLVNLVSHHRPHVLGMQDVKNKKVARLLEPTETPLVAVSPVLVLWAATSDWGSRLPCCSPPSSLTWQDIKKRSRAAAWTYRYSTRGSRSRTCSLSCTFRSWSLPSTRSSGQTWVAILSSPPSSGDVVWRQYTTRA
jgi:hypothetical protein